MGSNGAIGESESAVRYNLDRATLDALDRGSNYFVQDFAPTDWLAGIKFGTMTHCLSLKCVVYLRAIFRLNSYRDLAENSLFSYNFQTGEENSASKNHALEA